LSYFGGLIVSTDDVLGRLRHLQKEQEVLVEELKKLKKLYEKGEISEGEYEEKRKPIERSLVETMDRLAQMKYFFGQR